MNIFLKFFTPLYGAGVTLRNFGYDHALLESAISPVPIISVGNLTAGGSGKSPFTQEIANQLKHLNPGIRLSVVSRGYGRYGRGLRVVADENGLLLSAQVGGDEPVMLARNLPGTPVLVSEKRVNGVAEAVKRFDADVVLLDDAFQHRAISRTLDIVLLDETLPEWHYKLLPEGRLREFPHSLKRSHLIVLTGMGTPRRKREMRQWVAAHTSSPIIEGHLVPTLLKGVSEDKTLGISHLVGKQCYAVAGIARPQRFLDTLSQINIPIAGFRFFNDHAKFTFKTTQQIIHDAKLKNASAILLTEKDSVKWVNLQTAIPVYYLKMDWHWDIGEEILQSTLVKILER